jgi:hypothetical protein
MASELRFSGALSVVGLLLTTVPSVAHHSIQAQFDYDKPMTLTGQLHKVEWVNPHAYMYLDVKDSTGKVKTWALEMVGPGALRKAGLSREDRGGFKIGDTLTISGFASKDGSDTAFVKEIKMPSGVLITIWFGDPFAR